MSKYKTADAYVLHARDNRRSVDVNGNRKTMCGAHGYTMLENFLFGAPTLLNLPTCPTCALLMLAMEAHHG